MKPWILWRRIGNGREWVCAIGLKLGGNILDTRRELDPENMQRQRLMRDNVVWDYIRENYGNPAGAEGAVKPGADPARRDRGLPIPPEDATKP